MTVLSCDDAAARIARTDAPVLLLDTCSILDVVRAPVLGELGVHDIDAVHILIDRATGMRPEIALVITEHVHREFEENVDTVERYTHSEIEKTSDCFSEMVKRVRALAPDASIPGAVDLVSLGLPERGKRLAETIVETSLVLADHQEEIVKAFDRVRFARPPATKAKQSVKDCLIAESYLRLAATLRQVGFARNMVFTTSNTRDFQQGHPSLHPELRTEFHSVRLEYSPSWSAARHELDT